MQQLKLYSTLRRFFIIMYVQIMFGKTGIVKIVLNMFFMHFLNTGEVQSVSKEILWHLCSDIYTRYFNNIGSVHHRGYTG